MIPGTTCLSPKNRRDLRYQHLPPTHPLHHVVFGTSGLSNNPWDLFYQGKYYLREVLSLRYSVLPFTSFTLVLISVKLSDPFYIGPHRIRHILHIPNNFKHMGT